MAAAGRKPIHTDDIKIDQKASVDADGPRESEIIKAETVPNKDYADELAFNEEPVTIRIEPGSEKNAATSVPVWVNGRGAEVLINGKWVEIKYLPVNSILTTKRKYVGELLRAKTDRIETVIVRIPDEDPRNRVNRYTSALCTFSIIRDDNPRGPDWALELRQRNF